VRLDHSASRIVNTNHGTLRSAVKLRVTDCVADRVGLTVQQPTEGKHIGDQIDPAMILARADFVKVILRGS
jgi:hypothetical protein